LFNCFGIVLGSCITLLCHKPFLVTARAGLPSCFHPSMASAWISRTALPLWLVDSVGRSCGQYAIVSVTAFLEGIRQCYADSDDQCSLADRLVISHCSIAVSSRIDSRLLSVGNRSVVNKIKVARYCRLLFCHLPRKASPRAVDSAALGFLATDPACALYQGQPLSL
jgi:hypothetical protein